jgi:two-component system sensor histidine kinase PilS (NtrC family)
MRANRLAERLVVMPEAYSRHKRLMHLYFTYRVMLAVGLVVFAATGIGPSFLGIVAPKLHIITVLVYLILTIASLGLSFFDLGAVELEYSFAMIVDSIVIAILLFTSGGPASGLGILLGISIAFGAQGMPSRTAMFSAAIATIAIFIESWVAATINNTPVRHFSLLAMLGVSYFILAYLSRELSTRTLLSERLVKQQGRDIANLTELNEQVIHHMQTGVVILDADNRIKMLNDAAWQFLDRPISTIGYTIRQISPELDKALLEWKQQPSPRQRHLHTQAEGHDLMVKFQRLGDSDNSGTLVFLDDASRAAEAAQQLKLASLGTLVASIAHEIRNPLGAIGHASQLLQESEELQGTDRRMAEIIDKNTARLNEVIENILSLSRQRAVKPEKIRLELWLAKLSRELVHNHQLQENQIIYYLSPQDTSLVFDPQQLSQVINALVDNAVKHQPEKGEKLVITITGGMDTSTRDGYIEVIDNGRTIPSDIVDKLFDPFFTTSNEGTGLGLYVVKELCDANNIRISYIPVSSGGNCFKLKFPRQ